MMRSAIKAWMLVIAAMGTSGVLFAQQPPAKAAFSPRDLSGVWTAARLGIDSGYRLYTFMPEEPSMTAWAKERFERTKPSFGPRSFKDSNDPVNPTIVGQQGCYPPGVPRIYLHPFPFEIVQTPNRTIFLYEFDHQVRQVSTDGRPLPVDAQDTYMGYSIGRWDGDTFVVETSGFNDKTWADRAGHPHSDMMKVTERFKRPDANTLAVDVTIDDPIAYTKPWGGHLVFSLRPKWTISEMICLDNANFDSFLKNEQVPGK
ncbi:MAG TPA: hypothetical protein VGR73_07230 [Bryobacteraceae bacterium]|nr:hypothetical protein [Bryobacteraceae bacterium]